MGCKSSKLNNNSEVSWRCRKRKRMMSDAIKYQREFAVAHLAYVKVLRTLGPALSQYADRQLSGLEVVPVSSSVQNSGPIAKPEASKPPLQIYLKPPPSSSSKSPAEPPAPVAPTTSEPGPSQSNSDVKATESVPITQENSEPVISTGSFSPNLESVEQELPGDVLMSSVPSSPIGGSSPFVWSQPSSPLNSDDWDPFNLFASVPLRPPDLTSRYLQDWDASFQTYDYDGVDGLPELEEDDADDKREVNEASQSTAVSPPEMAKAVESPVKPEKKRTEANTEKLLETIKEESTEMGEGSSEVATAENQEKDAPQKVKDPAGATVDTVKPISECVVKIKDAFARASESGHEVSNMLETHIVHPPMRTLSLPDSFGLVRSMSWRLSRKSISSQMSFEEPESDDEWKQDSHILTLEKLYTWEKKLYKEVKVGEQLHIAFSRKSKEFHIADSKGKDPDLIEECRADMKSLESQLVVAFRAISTVSMRIQKLTSEELYPQLIELLRRLKMMWKAMLECHTAQKAIALEILTIEKSGQKFTASESHRSAAVELENQLETWQQCFDLWVVAQQRYIDTLHTWTRVCHMGPEPNVKKRDATPPALPAPGKAPIYALTRNWHDSLLRLEESKKVVAVINEFVGLVHRAQVSESEELAAIKRAEMQSRSMDRRSRTRVLGQEQSIIPADKNASNEVQTEDVVLSSLQRHLPAIFEALTTFSSLACREYEKLHGGADTSSEE